MTSLSIAFAKAIATGRRTPAAPTTRERVLVTLLRKRAAAHNAGAEELEQLLRRQILWSLPTRFGEVDQAETGIREVA